MMMVIDSSYLLYRSYFAYPRLMHNGMHTGGFYGFAKTIIKLVEDYHPDILVCAFDLPDQTWRHKEAELYKAQRKPAEADMIIQIPVIKQWCERITPNCFESSGFEADDIIATVIKQYLATEGVEWAKRAEYMAELGHEYSFAAHSIHMATSQPARTVLIFSADRDLYQLLRFPGVKCIQVKKEGKKTAEVLFGLDEFIAQYGIHPDQWVDVKALVGDSSDNLKGVPGIGPKTAVAIINGVGCLRYAFDAIGLDGSSLPLCTHPSYSKERAAQYLALKPDIVRKLREYYPLILDTYRLVTLQDVPGITVKNESPDVTRGRDIFLEYGFNSLVREIDVMLARRHSAEPLF